MYVIYSECLEFLQIIRRNTIEKWAKDLHRSFMPEETQMANKFIRACPIIISNQENTH